MLSALKNFGVTFLVAALIFGVIAYFATSFVTGTVESIFKSEKEKLESIISDTAEKPDDDLGGVVPGGDAEEIEGESFSFLMITTDYLPDEYDDYILTSEDTVYFSEVVPYETLGVINGRRSPDLTSITLVVVSKETRSVVYSYLTPYMRVQTAAGSRTLSEIYYMYGEEMLEEYITSLTGIRPDWYFLLSGGKFDGFTTSAGTVTASNPNNVYFDGTGYTYSPTSQVDGFDTAGQRVTYSRDNEFVLYAGELDMTADRLFTALSVTEKTKSDLTAKQTTVLNIAEGYISGFASLSKAILGETITNMTTVKEALATDFTAHDLDADYTLFSSIGTFDTVRLIYPVTYKPASDNASEYYKPDYDKGVELFAKYRPSTVK